MRIKAALMTLAFMAIASPAVAGIVECSVEKDCNSLVGKRLWIVVPRGNPNPVEVTFRRHDWDNSLKLWSGSFIVTSIAHGPNPENQDFVVKLPDGRTGWVGTDQSIFLRLSDPVADAKNARADCEQRGPPKLGMTSAELLASCWGKPLRVVKITTASGVEENFVYGAGHNVKFTDGKVSEIVEKR